MIKKLLPEKNNKAAFSKKKANPGVRRKYIIYYKRTLATLKIGLALFVLALCFTNIFATQKHKLKMYLLQRTANWGFALHDVVVNGRNRTPVREVLDELNIKLNQPIFALDLEQIQDALQEQCWVEKAVVRRKLANTLYIDLVEKVPIAIWQHNKGLFLVDADGEVITEFKSTDGDFLRVVGQGGNTHAKQLMDWLSTNPTLAQRVVAARRIGERRWDLIFDNQLVALMPEVGFTDAFQTLEKLQNDLRLESIDMRDHGKYYLRFRELPI